MNDPVVDDRLSTGSAQADEILGGGFPKNSINIIMGQPGTGKTVFAEHLAFHNADGDRPVLYLTTLSEPLAKIIKYLQGFAFYDESRMGTAILYEDLGSQLSQGGVKALLPIVSDAIRTLAPKIIIIDSFKALHDLSPSIIEMRQMLYELTGMLSAYATTVFFVGEYTEEHSRNLPEFAVADAIIQMMRTTQSTRDERFLRVLKLRGSGYMEGLHAFKITPAGLDVYPRLVTPEIPTTYRLNIERIPSGIEGLDRLMGGGIRTGSTTLLAGPTGSGKTTIGLQFALEALTERVPALFINFQENPTLLQQSIRSMRVQIQDLEAAGLKFMYASPVELQIDSLIVSLFRRIRDEKIQRVVIDSISDLVTVASDRERVHDYLYSLIQHLTVNGVTSVLAYETASGLAASGVGVPGDRISFMADNVVLLSMDMKDKIKRTLAVVKARGSAHDLNIHPIEIGVTGVRVL